MQLSHILTTLHETFRDNGRSTHADPTILAAFGERSAVSLGGRQGSYLENYARRIRAAAQGARFSEVRIEDHPERMLFSNTVPTLDDENSGSVGGWMIAWIAGLAMLLIILSRC